MYLQLRQKLFFVLLVTGSFFHAEVSIAQCGVAATSGTVTIAAANSIVNSYYPGTLSPVIGATTLTVGAIDARGSASTIGAGDLVMIMQMQGADINTSNTNSYGDGAAGAPASGYLGTNLYAGYYEYNTVASVAGSVLTFSYGLANNYYTQTYTAVNSVRRYQVIKVPRYFNLTINASSGVTAPAWNGSTGGVVVIEAANIVTFTASSSAVTVSGLGFRGGGGKQLTGVTAGNTNGSTTITNTDYRFNSAFTTAANATGGAKGEGIAGTPVYIPNAAGSTTTTGTVEGYINGCVGWGAPANAGGGGTDGDPTQNQYNTGGGGGANAGAGGNGGSGWDGTGGNPATYATGGAGGSKFTQAGMARVIMGGGGGAGSANNSSLATEYFCSGASGGGIIFIRAKSYSGAGTITADGSSATDITTGGQTDAAGGGGAGGSIILVTTQTGATGLGSVTASAKGGNGGNMTTYYSHGPGGGGGGGIIYTNGTLASTSVIAGTNGKTHTCCAVGNPQTDSYGSAPGAAGSVVLLSVYPHLYNANNALSPCGVLPVTLKEFKASVSNETSVLLSWRVEQQANFKSFVVEYSTDGRNFTGLSTIYFDANKENYTLTQQPTGGNVYYYRLKMVDTDGSFTYSPVLVVRLAAYSAHVLSVYPNPSMQHVTISLQVLVNQQGKIELVDNSGRLIVSKQFSATAGQNYIIFPEFEQLPAGTYHLRASADGHNYTQKLVKLRN